MQSIGRCVMQFVIQNTLSVGMYMLYIYIQVDMVRTYIEVVYSMSKTSNCVEKVRSEPRNNNPVQQRLRKKKEKGIFVLLLLLLLLWLLLGGIQPGGKREGPIILLLLLLLLFRQRLASSCRAVRS